MANNKTGFDFYNVDTNRYQDMKIKRLKKTFGCNGLSVYDYILCEIYRVRGCFVEWDENTAFDVADYFGIKESLVNEIVNYCCAVGLFSKELLASERVLTSLSIQKRYLDMCVRSKRAINVIPEKIKLPEECPKLPEECPKLPEECPKLPEVCRRVEKSKESPPTPPRGESECFSKPQSRNPYPALGKAIENALEPKVYDVFEKLIVSRGNHGIQIDAVQQENYLKTLLETTSEPEEQIEILRYNIDGGTWKRLCIPDKVQNVRFARAKKADDAKKEEHEAEMIRKWRELHNK